MRENSSSPPPAPQAHAHPQQRARPGTISPTGLSRDRPPEAPQKEMEERTHFVPPVELLILPVTLTVPDLSSF